MTVSIGGVMTPGRTTRLPSRADLLIQSHLRTLNENLRLAAAAEAWRCESRKWRRRAFFWFAVAWLETVAVIIWAVTR